MVMRMIRSIFTWRSCGIDSYHEFDKIIERKISNVSSQLRPKGLITFFSNKQLQHLNQGCHY